MFVEAPPAATFPPDRTGAPPVSLWERLTRVTSSTRFIPEIDGLRFVAIGLVVLYHLLGIISVRRWGEWKPERFHDNLALRLLTYGHFGVPLFFVISGFILGKPFAEAHLCGHARPPLRSYYLRRFSRLEPPYIANLLVLFVASLLLSHFAWRDLGHLLASVTYTHALFYNTASTVNAVAWSLEVEAQFYLLAPLLAGVFAVRSTPWRRVLLLALIIGGGWLSGHALPGSVDPWNGDRWRMSLLNYLQYFFAGFLLCDWFLTHPRNVSPEPGRSKVFGDVASLLGWTAVGWIMLNDFRWQSLLPFAILIAYAGALYGGVSSAFFRWRGVYLVGGMCYSIYLWHQPIMMAWGKWGLPRSWAERFGLGWNVLIQSCIASSLVIGIGAVCFVFLERPFMERHWARRWRQALLHVRAAGENQSIQA